MNKISKILIWYYMLTKRLFKHYSFIIILLAIPLLIPIANNSMKSDAGLITIALHARSDDASSNEIINKLTNENTVIRYRVCETEAEASKLVESGKADAAWIFHKDLTKKMLYFGSGESKKPFIDVIRREENVATNMANEKLFGAVFEYISYGALEKYIYENALTEAQLSKEELFSIFKQTNVYDNIVDVKMLNTNEALSSNKNILTAPLRGLLSLIIMLCGMAAAMWFIKDISDGKFDWLAPKKRLLPAFGSCFAATSVSSVAVFITLLILRVSANWLYELILMMLFSFCAAGFCLVLCLLFRSFGKLGAAIPFFMLIMLVLCPIFLNIKGLMPIKLLLPPYIYLNSVYSIKYFLYMLIYCVAIYLFSFALNAILNGKKLK